MRNYTHKWVYESSKCCHVNSYKVIVYYFSFSKHVDIMHVYFSVYNDS